MKDKNERVQALEEVIAKIKGLGLFYKQAYPAWILIQNAYGHIQSIHHLETETSIDEETLGVKDEARNKS